MPDDAGKPTILLPYPGPEYDEDLLDIFVYVRPETNGVEIESRLLHVVKNCAAYHAGLELVYMANLPGEYMVEHQVVEFHYAHRLYFAVHGAASFTPAMASQFERSTGERFDSEKVLGGFEALNVLATTPEGLFSLWVDEQSVVTVAGQTIKKIDGYWVIGYDIPALVHKNTRDTDIAVMLFRSRVGYPYFVHLVEQMYAEIRADRLVNPRLPRGRVFHYSRSPFEQILDAVGYLIVESGVPVELSDISFAQYLNKGGLSYDEISAILRNPIFLWDSGVSGEALSSDRNSISSLLIELDIYHATAHGTYAESLSKLCRAKGQRLLDRERRIPAQL